MFFIINYKSNYCKLKNNINSLLKLINNTVLVVHKAMKLQIKGNFETELST